MRHKVTDAADSVVRKAKPRPQFGIFTSELCKFVPVQNIVVWQFNQWITTKSWCNIVVVICKITPSIH